MTQKVDKKQVVKQIDEKIAELEQLKSKLESDEGSNEPDITKPEVKDDNWKIAHTLPKWKRSRLKPDDYEEYLRKCKRIKT